MKKIALGTAGIIFYYLATVLTLFILTSIFNDSFENIWLSAISVTVIAILLQLGFYAWKKRKKSR